jgi:DUF2075 family protein
LIPYVGNARTHGASQVAEIAGSIRAFGFSNPILVGAEGDMIAGHGRLAAARQLRMSEVPVIVLHGLTDIQRRALILADNRIAMNAGWDLKMLACEMKDLSLMGADLKALGFKKSELAIALRPEMAGLTDENELPDCADTAVSTPGDIWGLGQHRVACGDCTDSDIVEAQRAWDRDHLANFMSRKKGIANFDMSEPAFLISVLDRHDDWCVVICLIGGGQEINAGEAGLTEWFQALQTRFSTWKVFTSPQLAHRDYHWGQDLKAMLAEVDVTIYEHLHLAVSIRSFRAEKLSDFVGAVVAGELEAARDLYNQIKATYPIKLTRDLATARAWLRSKARGTERVGFVASSGASRLKPLGLNVHEKIDATHWFLNGRDDVRSSHYLEDPATEFDIQGLELDWVGVCWDADFRSVNGKWAFHRFTGTKWQNVNDENRKIYLTNAYRVLLTRARQGLVIYIPKGDAEDATRPAAFYDGTAAFLRECGLPLL